MRIWFHKQHLRRSGHKAGINLLLCLAVIFSSLLVLLPAPARADDPAWMSNSYVTKITDIHGKKLLKIIVPGKLPAVSAQAASAPEKVTATAPNGLGNVPAFRWSYGCSPTAAAMLFGYYDLNGFPNMYTGPANGGVCPPDNQAVWGWGWGPAAYGYECPISATHLGIDGRTTKGHVDDYWIAFGNAGPDPYITGSWAQHSPLDCAADFMGTNQSKYGSPDGSTTFYYNPTGDPLDDFTGMEPSDRDGCHGMRLYAEWKGYAVDTNFTQLIQGRGSDPTGGFTFENYRAEIDAGRPVLIQLDGHTTLGYGYDAATNEIWMHDTWDFNDHKMTWGSTYSSSSGPLLQWGVTVIRLSGASTKFIGANSADSGNSGHGTDSLYLTRYLAEETGNITTVRVKSTAAGNVKVAIYADASGSPGALLNANSTGTAVVAGQWNNIPVTSTPVTINTYYWLGIKCDTAGAGAWGNTGTMRYAAATYAGAFPASIGATSSLNYHSLIAGRGAPPGPSAPTVTNASGATNIAATSATLNGNLSSDGGSSTSVTVYWGPTDGGTTEGSWAHNVPLGATAVGPFSTNITSLTTGMTYYYRCYGTNTTGPAWATTSASFVAAATPIKLIGAAATDSSNSGHGMGNLYLTRYQAEGTGNVTSIKVKSASAGNVKVAIYADASSSPGTLLNANSTGAAVLAGQWNNIPVTSTPVTINTYYWLGIKCDTPGAGAWGNTGTMRYISTPYAAVFPASASTSTSLGSLHSVIAGWGAPPGPSVPTVTNASGATNIAATSATLNGNLSSDGGSSTSVTVYWGPTDGGTTEGSWAHNVPLGATAVGPFSTNITGLTTGNTYYYRRYGTNTTGPAWATTSASFVAAATPIKLIGAAATDSSNSGHGMGNLYLTRYQAEGTGNVTSIKVKSTAAGNVKVAIYADASGSPGALLNANSTGTAVVAGQWNNMPITSTPVTINTYYWLGIKCDTSGAGAYGYNGTMRYISNPYASAFPTSASTSTSLGSLHSVIAGWSN